MSTEITPAMRRSILIAALRDPKLWPEGFEFNWGRCSQCAMGLLYELMAPHKLYPNSTTTAELLGIEAGKARNIFVSADGYEGIPTPEQIADRLESLHNAMGEK